MLGEENFLSRETLSTMEKLRMWHIRTDIRQVFKNIVFFLSTYCLRDIIFLVNINIVLFKFVYVIYKQQVKSGDVCIAKWNVNIPTVRLIDLL